MSFLETEETQCACAQVFLYQCKGILAQFLSFWSLAALTNEVLIHAAHLPS